MSEDGAKSGLPDARKMEQSLLRTALVLAAIAVLAPLGLHLLFERQAQRLEALGDHGVAVAASVTALTQDGSVHYEYVVNGAHFEWSVAHEDAPFGVGEQFTAHYLPELPSFSRPGADRSSATREAAANRSGARKGLLAFFWFFGVFAAFSALELGILRRRGVLAYTSPEGRASGMRRRLGLFGAAIAPLLIAIFAWHASDAAAQGESEIPVVLGAALSLAVLGGTLAYALREGPSRAPARAARLARWAVPLALVLAAIRLLVTLCGS